MNWEGCKKQLWHNIRYCLGISCEELRNTLKNQRIASLHVEIYFQDSMQSPGTNVNYLATFGREELN